MLPIYIHKRMDTGSLGQSGLNAVPVVVEVIKRVREIVRYLKMVANLVQAKWIRLKHVRNNRVQVSVGTILTYQYVYRSVKVSFNTNH